MISIQKLFKKYFIILTVFILIIQIILSVVIFYITYNNFKQNTLSVAEFSSLIISSFENEVILKMNRFNELFDEIKKDIYKVDKYDLNYIIDRIGKTENIKDYSIALISENGTIFESNINEEKGLNLYILPDAKERLVEAKTTLRKYLDFPIYNTQINTFFAYILQYLPDKNTYLQIGYKIDLLDEFLNKLNRMDIISSENYNVSIYHFNRFNNKIGYIRLIGSDKKEYIEILHNMLKENILRYYSNLFPRIIIAHLLVPKDQFSPYGLLYIIDHKPDFYKGIKQIIYFNMVFVLIYLFLYFYYKLKIKRQVISPLNNIITSITNSSPIVDNKSSDIIEIELLKNSYKEHLENIKLRDILKQVLEAQEEEREKIAKEIHDTILQDLNYILIQISRANMKDLSSILKNDIRSLRTFLIESDLIKLQKYGFTKVVYEFLDEMKIKFPNINFEFNTTIQDDLLDEKKYLLILKIIKELIINAAKHSGGNYVGIKLFKSDKRLHLIVEDNGRWFDMDKSFSKEGHIGLKLVKERVFILKGEMKISTKNGTTFEIIIPLNED